MDGERLLSAIITTLVGFGCASVFYGIGYWASKRSDPMHFYSGTAVNAADVSDVKAYNAENAKMWKQFSVLFWLTGFCGIAGYFWDWAVYVTLALLIGSCTVGLLWLVSRYNKICRKYMIR